MFKKPLGLFSKLCTPAKIYLVISLISFITLFLQNSNDPNYYCVGMFKAKSGCNNKIYFLFKIVYIIFWTFILQKLCSKGYKYVSWILVLLPFILMFIGIGLLLYTLLKLR